MEVGGLYSLLKQILIIYSCERIKVSIGNGIHLKLCFDSDLSAHNIY